MKVDYIFTNISQLITCKDIGHIKTGEEMKDLGIIEDASFAVKDGKIVAIGKKLENEIEANYVFNLGGRVVMPGFVDPHTHSCFIGTREDEYLMRINGEEYIKILQKGGGILRSVQYVRNATFFELVRSTASNLNWLLRNGITTAEVKTGYGLTFKDEIRMLDVIQTAKKYSPVNTVSTFLSAHAFPKEKTKDAWIEEIINVHLPFVAKYRKDVKWIDVFCENKVFDYEATDKILEKATQLELKVKLHADEIDYSRGADLAIKYKAKTADHLLKTPIEVLEGFKESNTVAVFLPATSYALRKPVRNLREIVDRNIPMALSTDFNPGSSFTPSAIFTLSLAVHLGNLTLEEAITAYTINSAYALDLQDRKGSLDIGKDADFLVLGATNYAFLTYTQLQNLVQDTFLRGQLIRFY